MAVPEVLAGLGDQVYRPDLAVLEGLGHPEGTCKSFDADTICSPVCGTFEHLRPRPGEVYFRALLLWSPVVFRGLHIAAYVAEDWRLELPTQRTAGGCLRAAGYQGRAS